MRRAAAFISGRSRYLGLKFFAWNRTFSGIQKSHSYASEEKETMGTCFSFILSTRTLTCLCRAFHASERLPGPAGA